MSEDGLSEPCDEPSIELFVESLTGTSFEMRVYSTDTVLDIKNKIFRVEGIPIPQQHLLFQMKELNDHSRLADLGIVNGCTLRLVTAMRGGPISTRRWTSDHMVWKDLKDLIEHTREELGDKLGTKVSVLVFKEGEVIKWLRVIENEDGSYSPYTEHRAIAPPCTSSGNRGGCIDGGGGGGSVGSRSGSKHYQQHKSSTTDAATLSSNTIDFQDLMQFKQHASALSYYHQQHQHHQNHHSQSHHLANGTSTVLNGIGDQQHQLQQHQQHQYQRQQVYRRLEDDVRMKGRVKVLKARMQRAKRNKGKAGVVPSSNEDANGLIGEVGAAEQIAANSQINNLVMTAVRNNNDDDVDDDVDYMDDSLKSALHLETILRALQNGDNVVPINDRYTITSKYHRRTHNHRTNSHLLQLDTSQVPDDDLTLFKPIPTGHCSTKQGDGSDATYLVGTSNSAINGSTAGGGNTNNAPTNNGLNLLLMDCAPSTTAAKTTMKSSDACGSSTNSSANDLEVALKEKHRSNRLRLHATTTAIMKSASFADLAVDAMEKSMKAAVIGRRLSNSIDPTSGTNSSNITSVTSSPQSATLNNTPATNSYICTNLHVFEPQHDVITPGIRHDISPKRRGGKASAFTSTTSATGDFTRERLTLPDTKRRAKIGRLLNTTTTPGSGETSDSDDGLWSSQATATTANRLRHYRPTAMRLVLPDTATPDKGKCGDVVDPSLLADERHIILPDIWEQHGTTSVTASASPDSTGAINKGAGLLCARANTLASSNTTAAMDSADIVDDGSNAAAACIRGYMDLDSEFDKMFSELRNTVPIPSLPSAIPPQYAPKDCQLYLGSPVVPRPTPSSNESATLCKSTATVATAAAAASATATAHRLSPMGILPYHVHGLCTSPTAATSTRRSPLYHRRTTATASAAATSMSSSSTSDEDRAAIAAAAKSMLEKIQRTSASDIGGIVSDNKAVRQRRRRYSTDDYEFTLERLQNDYVPEGFDYGDFDSYPADVDDMIGCYGQEAVVNARWMEAAAAATGARTTGTSPPQLPPVQRQRNAVRVRTAAHRDSPTDHHLHHHLCLAEQIQRLGIDTDNFRNESVTASLSNTIGTRMGVVGTTRTPNDNTSNTINIAELAHGNYFRNVLAASGNSNGSNTIGNNTKLPTLVEHGGKQQQQQQPLNTSESIAVAASTERATVPRMRCAHCKRKLNITNIYDCRCGRIFCAQHRYSEVHDCAHDYKTEGRRLLAQQNPLVSAPKLAKF